MNSPEKHSQNEKLNALQAQIELFLDLQMEDMEANAPSIRILLMIIELIETLKLPDPPG